MKLLVTGGAGFIGSNFILYWFQKHPEDQIVNLDKLTYAGNLENLSSIKDNPKYSFAHGDICDPALVDKAMKDVDTVVHFAADSHVDRSILDPDPFIKTNIEGTYILLKAALKNKVKKFHHVSTDEVFGSLSLDSKDKFNEKTPYDPRSPYSASKASSDHLVRAFHETYELPITISNCSNNFGPYQFPEKLIPLAITNLMEGKKVPIYGDGLYIRDWLYVEDHCEAINLVLQKGKNGETYLVGGLTQDIPNIDIVKKILQVMGHDESSTEQVKDRPGHDRRYSIDWSKIKNELGWEPKHSFDQALKETVDWYKTNKNWWKHVKSGEYREYYKKQYDNA
ncbi:dTDP-glucose 4,6-dehydratase [Candidatus Roizmanbacteria bacterium RIFCSPLOWO2_12_FULL_40_12]|uniref:dTDP-glucose 4,6-dehydratase n=1 Tax=Candidatus Roizmanbacteria bacterium RIFCSPLOWO2_01_FULL_40_42 TaxID=1802066 RepID=A0A1F7J4F9_9BACT|nr:MAG: dTDP-glucose 4,6-dehydratase [Candidatus Roizmanbacteria bacterium RIFCSPHIGHO2_01_FULL_40_98]OGK27262.1 MAG: dTDP-glucose 4,6-dehydratase [Candidatus Roizmanbacteria bacterium RIFCSPHIGHO2_02_FULL_40_53]OGK30866.1 MAG: dTDP-glucose 4,6-dehydratase [Candidatus Roizmanbacteria bacterium RIFCSPHIGHO2_12_41_18]OGK36367.1 MAG: dTDP-glucose 4,6-dehydratase [Candidatus Roizmanbacteria bacterium RIFCSPHIGHO2_12_FULL_40_130]OGK50495.1 MAG: dTDP-glucose 4,6-dehydratase [Candidatus Roizmanbacteri